MMENDMMSEIDRLSLENDSLRATMLAIQICAADVLEDWVGISEPYVPEHLMDIKRIYDMVTEWIVS